MFHLEYDSVLYLHIAALTSGIMSLLSPTQREALDQLHAVTASTTPSARQRDERILRDCGWNVQVRQNPPLCHDSPSRQRPRPSLCHLKLKQPTMLVHPGRPPQVLMGQVMSTRRLARVDCLGPVLVPLDEPASREGAPLDLQEGFCGAC
jgi:hypothetical protein